MESRCFPPRLYVHGFPFSPHRTGSRFNQLDDAQAEVSVRLGRLGRARCSPTKCSTPTLNASVPTEFRRPHVSGPLSDTHLMDLLWVIA
jgi:hypothetical protein